MARVRQDRRQQAPTVPALGGVLAQPAALVLSVALGLPHALAPAPALASPGLAEGSAVAQAGAPGQGLGQVMDNGIVPRNGSSCPLVVPSQMSFLQPKRLRPEEVKSKNAGGCLSAADAIYGADGCPLKLCPNPQWQGL